MPPAEDAPSAGPARPPPSVRGTATGSRVLLQSPAAAFPLGSNDDQLERARARAAARAVSVRRHSLTASIASSKDPRHDIFNREQLMDIYHNCIMLASEDEFDEYNNFAPPKNPKSLRLPASRPICSNKLPEDCHYRPESLVKLFLLPDVPCLSKRRRKTIGERCITAIKAIKNAEAGAIRSQLQLLRSYFSKEQLEANALEHFKENLPNLSIVPNEKCDVLELKWNEGDYCILGDFIDDKILQALIASLPTAGDLQFPGDSVGKDFYRRTSSFSDFDVILVVYSLLLIGVTSVPAVLFSAFLLLMY